MSVKAQIASRIRRSTQRKRIHQINHNLYSHRDRLLLDNNHDTLPSNK